MVSSPTLFIGKGTYKWPKSNTTEGVEGPGPCGSYSLLSICLKLAVYIYIIVS